MIPRGARYPLQAKTLPIYSRTRRYRRRRHGRAVPGDPGHLGADAAARSLRAGGGRGRGRGGLGGPGHEPRRAALRVRGGRRARLRAGERVGEPARQRDGERPAGRRHGRRRPLPRLLPEHDVRERRRVPSLRPPKGRAVPQRVRGRVGHPHRRGLLSVHVPRGDVEADDGGAQRLRARRRGREPRAPRRLVRRRRRPRGRQPRDHDLRDPRHAQRHRVHARRDDAGRGARVPRGARGHGPLRAPRDPVAVRGRPVAVSGRPVRGLRHGRRPG